MLTGDFLETCAIARVYRSDWIPNGTCRGCQAAIVSQKRLIWCSAKCTRKTWRAFTKGHRWTTARKAALRHAKRRCDVCGTSERLEVNHRDPRVGKGYGYSCAHHGENLQVLCHAHHVEVTNTQRLARRDSKTLLKIPKSSRGVDTLGMASFEKLGRKRSSRAGSPSVISVTVSSCP